MSYGLSICTSVCPQGAGLRSFLAVPIGMANEATGLLTIAKEAPNAFDDEW